MHINNKKDIQPFRQYYRIFDVIRHGQDKDLAFIHENYFGNTKELANYATQSIENAQLATIYISALIYAGYRWDKKLLRDFSNKLIKENKDNNDDLRKNILIAHAAEICAFYNCTNKPEIHLECHDALNLLHRKAPELQNIEVNIDKTRYWEAKAFKHFIRDQKKYDLTLNGYDTFITHYVENELMKENMGNVISLTTNAKAFQIN